MNYVSFPGLGIEPFHMNKTFEVFGRPIAWYGLIICIGMILAVAYSMFRAKYTEKISVDSITDLAFFLVIFGIIGARAYYVLTSLDKYDSFYDVIAIWEGGLAIYGALIAGALTILTVCHIKKIKFFIL